MSLSMRSNTNFRLRRLSWIGALCVGFTLGAFVMPESAIAGDWNANFSTLSSAAYNDNPSLATENAKGRMDFTINRSVDGEYAKDRYRVAIVGRANVVASKDEIAKSVFAADQVRYNLDVDGAYDYDTSVISAAFGLGFDTVQNTEFEDTGNLTSDVTRTNTNLSLSYSGQITELWSVNISDNYSSATYSGGDFTGYSSNSVNVGLSNTFSDRLTISPSFGFSRYMPDSDITSPSNTISLKIGGEYQLSEIDILSASLGLVQTGDTLGTSAQLSYSQEVLERLTVNANVTRNHTASGSGSVQQSTGFGGGASYQLFEMTQVGFNASYRTSSSVGASGSAVTTQLSLDPSINWTLSEKWSAGLNLQSRQQKQPVGGTASSRSVTFALNYNLPLE